MINLILHYLLALPDIIPSKGPPPRPSISAARRRKSMDLATMMAEKKNSSATPLLFNLVDLILACLRSRNQQTIYVTLQLVTAILKRHHRYAVMTLLRTEVLPTHSSNRTVGAHEQEIEYLMDLASSIGGYGNFDETYDHILKDTMARLESHPCSLRLVAPKVSTNNHKLPAVPDSLPGAPREVREHTLRHDDPLLNSILDLMESFFINPVETNLSVTETIVDLAICGYMSVEGWVARDPKTYMYNSEEADEDVNMKDEEDEEDEEDAEDDKSQGGDGQQDVSTASETEKPPISPVEKDKESTEEAKRMAALKKCRERPTWNQESLPRILKLLQVLCDQVSNYKDNIPRFDELLQQRREAFQTADSILDNAPPPPISKDSPQLPQFGTPLPDRMNVDETIRVGSPARPSALEGFAQRLLSELGTPSRSASPRSQRDHTARSSGASTPGGPPSSAGGHDLAVPRAMPVPPKDYPIAQNLARSLSPSMRDETASNVSGGGSSRHGHESGMGGDLSSSRVAEFAAIDQSILARRVGLPERTLKPIPLDLSRRRTMRQGPEMALSDDSDEDQDSDAEYNSAKIAADEDEYAEPEETEAAPVDDSTVTVSHVLTNVIIFQSFMMEVASLLQVRAGLFDEVRYV